MLTATRDHEPRAIAPFGPATPPRTFVSRFTSGAQLVGSLVGIPLALIGGYSTYHANFSPEAKCQALRANIVSMLDKKMDASTLRLLAHRDVVTFERDCGLVDAEAAAAFKTLLATEQPAKAGKPEKRETAKAEKAEPAKKPPAAVAPKREIKREAEKAVPETKPVTVAAAASDTTGIDAAWVASVRNVLLESASRPPAAAAAPEFAAPMPEPIVVPAEPRVSADAVAPAPHASAPRPPAPIPNVN